MHDTDRIDGDHLRQLLKGIDHLLAAVTHHPAAAEVTIALARDCRRSIGWAIDGVDNPPSPSDVVIDFDRGDIDPAASL